MIYPIAAGLFSGFVATAMGYDITEVGYWAISAPWIMLGALGYAYSKKG